MIWVGLCGPSGEEADITPVSHVHGIELGGTIQVTSIKVQKAQSLGLLLRSKISCVLVVHDSFSVCGVNRNICMEAVGIWIDGD